MLAYLQSNFIKIKKTSFLKVHILAALLFPLLLFLYWLQRGDIQGRTSLYSYFQLIGVLLPFASGIVNIQLKNLEEESGKYKYLLGYSKSNYKPFFAELIFQWLCYCIVLLISITLFSSFLKIGGVTLYSRLLCLNIIVFITLAFVTYIINHIICYLFSTGVALGISMMGVIVAAFCETSLGEKVWYLIPWSWLLRISGAVFNQEEIVITQIFTIIIISIIMFLLHIRIFQDWNQDRLTSS
ncbi:lantibiotic immunity ABC transporter MutG family permease subunit [Streptococcus suis]|uniref:lantibiotic immunity ABC transporter MutG family permease subunit n=1 Tax=Streptococcus TaxID=1301 RepID=UPI000F63243F|nr:lantibiotic immunity ABC transporter MutG family permease subunit [Streptococcus suis]RRR54960.1 lantibiotic immunity ABC transporter MutG family permease subunit [Streptococcus suis]HEL1796074.1 lantibiotic immunity ABC transporter MutG family permease subunit [Streptococcus suis]HEL1797560.1 lantibiotic immunity ABC transporter MutG family permease subunit [Streptococcus suis]